MSDWKVVCEKCPCLNNDFEQGGSCNLGYEVDLVSIPQGKSFDTIYVSKNCELIEIRYGNKIFIPIVEVSHV